MPNTPRAILDHELDTPILAVTDALDLAHAGKVADGYTTLVGGLERAREINEMDAPLWGPELVRRWELAGDRYCEMFGPTME